MLYSIQYTRAFASWLVVWTHLSGFEMMRPYLAGGFGGFGVDLFFIVSGFLMWETTVDQPPGQFALRRIARVVPAYWFYTGLLVLIAALAPKFAPRVQLDFAQVICSFIFIPHANQRGEVNPILLSGWTLNFEMYFYAIVFFALFVRSRAQRLMAVASFLMLAALAGAVLQPNQPMLSTYTSAIILEFLFGMLISVTYRSMRLGAFVPWVLMALSGAALIAASMDEPDARLRFIYFGLPSAGFILGLLALETQIRARPSPLLLALGDSSYSLYLVHPFVISSVAVVVRAAGRALGLAAWVQAVLLCVVGVLACAGVARLSFVLVEKRLGRMLLDRFSRRGSRLAAQGS